MRNINFKKKVIDNPVVSKKNRFHPTQKPIQIIKKLLKLHSKECVLDPFLGSGTTAVACECLNRRWIGIEIEEKYCEIAAKRIEKEVKKIKQMIVKPW